MSTFFGFAVAANMFPVNAIIRKVALTPEEVREMLEEGGVQSCLNPSHAATIAAAKQRFGIEVEIPDKAPRVTLGIGDAVIVMAVQGLARLEGRHEYTDKEIEGADFAFSIFEVLE